MAESDPFRWWRFPGSAGASFPVKRSEFDAALEGTPVEALREVVLRNDNDRSPPDFFRAVGISMPAKLDSADWLPLAEVTWWGQDQQPQLLADWSSPGFVDTVSTEPGELQSRSWPGSS